MSDSAQEDTLAQNPSVLVTWNKKKVLQKIEKKKEGLYWLI